MRRTLGIREKRILTIACLITIIFINIIQNVYILLVLASCTFVFLLRVKSNEHKGIRNLRLVFSMALVVSAIQMLTIGTTTIYNFKLIGLNVSVYQEGIIRGIFTFLRVMGSMGLILLLISVMRFNEFMGVLKWFGLPRAFFEVMLFAVKFIYIFREEITIIRKAQRARLGYKNVLLSVSSISNIAGMVLIRAYDRSKALERSMKSRGCIEGNEPFKEG